ncbi:TAXI family TRAP transporter solute-binding subunit [Shouchella shacheensis]|uniref:TAXI family TRAP transporter solute-binding subunit n=1 Tax=Shouchella shacheensis TaxID=1649580 RepID=UPI0007402AA9|nr:TAXI family TRAP transporter solute-binding subunit [Shouchella shacheensis]
MRKTPFYIAGLALALVACNGGEETTGNGNEGEGDVDTGGLDADFLTIATGGTSGVYYQIGAQVGTMLENELNSDVSVQATGASVENINLIDTGRAELAIVMADAVTQATEATGPFEETGAVENLTAIASLYPNFVQVVTTEDANIDSIEGLAGRNVGVGAANSGVELNAQMILEAHGMSYDDINEDYLSYSEAIDQIQNGMIEAAFVTSGLPNATVIDLSTQNDAKIVPIEGEGLAKLQELYPFFSEATIPAGTYDNEEDITTASIENLLIISNELSEDAVYDVTSALFDQLETLQNSHNAAADITIETVDQGLPIPFHPGAERYFEEQGALE